MMPEVNKISQFFPICTRKLIADSHYAINSNSTQTSLLCEANVKHVPKKAYTRQQFSNPLLGYYPFPLYKN